MVAKPALLWWAVGLAADHVRANLVPGQSLDELQIEELVNGLRGAHAKVSGTSASIGTAVHGLISAHLKGETVRAPVNEQIQAGFNAFLRFEQEHDFQIIDSERKVYSKELGVAGTVDCYGLLDGFETVIDIKTSATGQVYPEAFLQVGGYNVCLTEEIGAHISKHAIICCGRDGSLVVQMSDAVEEHRQGFIAAARLAKAMANIQKELKL